MDIEHARAEWSKVREDHCAFASLLQNKLSSISRELGIYAEVSARAKETHSLVKKLIRKPRLTYETLPDKVGARVIVRYRSELEPIESRVRQLFAFNAVDDKSKNLGTDKVGYQSIHVDSIALLPSDGDSARFPADTFFGELQIRTLGQHLWSEVSHDTFYENDELVNMLSPDLQRRVHLTAGLVEIADREFDRMHAEARPSPEAEIFDGLERLYYSIASRRPDVALSLEVIKLVLPLYGEMSPQAVLRDRIIPRFESNRQDLSEIYANPDNNHEQASAFFFQPEAFLIYDRLHADRDQLLAKWNEKFPERELARVASAFGFALDIS